MKTWSQLYFIALVVVACSQPQKTAETMETPDIETLPILIGTYTSEGSEGIYAAEFNTNTGNFVNLRAVAVSMDPSYLVPAKDGRHVYAVNEQDGGSVSVFAWNDKGTLDLLETKGSAGVHPCHIAINEANTMISVANYTSGNGGLFGLVDGRLSEALPYQHEGSGPNEERQEGPHAHFNTFHPMNDLLYAVDLGTDEIMKYETALDQKQLTGTAAYKMEPGDGPRHLDFHPTQPWAFVVNELSNTIMSFTVNEAGDFEPISRLSTLPEDFEDYSKAADIHVSPNGRYVYASNRGFDSIAIYEISGDGSLRHLGFEARGISTPRNFVISPDGSFLLVANQDSDSIIAFEVNKENGLMNPLGTPAKVSKPVCLKFY